MVDVAYCIVYNWVFLVRLQDRSLKAFWGECREDFLQTCVLVL